MLAASATIEGPLDTDLRERRCIVTGAVVPESGLVRFVIGPEGIVVPDVAARLPGRGLWVTADRASLERAVVKGHFSRAAKAPAGVTGDLPGRVETLLVARISGDLGMARRSGQLVLGFDNVARALERHPGPALLVEASDGAADGRRKLLGKLRGALPAIVDCLTGVELSLALGRENVVHAALKSGRLSERIAADACRLSGFRPSTGRVASAPAPGPDAACKKGCE